MCKVNILFTYLGGFIEIPGTGAAAGINNGLSVGRNRYPFFRFGGVSNLFSSSVFGGDGKYFTAADNGHVITFIGHSKFGCSAQGKVFYLSIIQVAHDFNVYFSRLTTRFQGVNLSLVTETQRPIHCLRKEAYRMIPKRSQGFGFIGSL